MITLELPADLLALRVIGPWLRAVLVYGGDPEAEANATKLELALQELCVNVIEHALDGSNDERLRLHYESITGSHQITVTDRGRPYDSSTKPEVDLSTLTVGGYGLHLVESLCDEVSYERRDDQNRWIVQLAMGDPLPR